MITPPHLDFKFCPRCKQKTARQAMSEDRLLMRVACHRCGYHGIIPGPGAFKG